MRLTLFFGILGCCLTCSAQKKELVWSDEFSGQELNTDFWNYELGDGCPNLCGWGNAERQRYTTDNHTIEEGKLLITASKDGDAYTSTRITTKGKKEFRYGRFEARAKLPVGEGLWPAFWMLGSSIDSIGWPRCGEIDILEYVGREPGQVFTTLHTADSYGNTKNTRKTKFEDIEEGFHVYATEWTPDQIAFFVDDQEVYTFIPENKSAEVWPFDQNFYILINLAIGGNFGGHTVDDSVFPQSYSIDYVRVYKLNY